MPLSRQDIGDDIVTQRRVFALGIEFDALTRQADGFVKVLSTVEIRLCEKKMALPTCLAEAMTTSNRLFARSSGGISSASTSACLIASMS